MGCGLRRLHASWTGVVVAGTVVCPALVACGSPSPFPWDGNTALVPEGVRCDAGECPEGMVRVPCGPFVMGSDPAVSGTPLEEPQHYVWLSVYCIDRTEATQREWAACAEAGACPAAREECLAAVGEDVPIACVSRAEAEGYCRWAGKRLPTEAEWEKAARGGCEATPPAECGDEDERRYPWGEAEPTCARANFAWVDTGSCADGPTAAGTRPEGASPYGVLDMAGNVAEWVADARDMNRPDYSPCPGECIDPFVAPGSCPTCTGLLTRGGSYRSSAAGITVTDRGMTNPYLEITARTGVRCAVTP